MQPSAPELRRELLALLRAKSLMRGEFTLASGAKSNYYIDCRLTTFDARGAWLVGQCVYSLVQAEAVRRGIRVEAVGGLTLGADPVALATAIASHQAGDQPVHAFTVRKQAKTHGQGRRIEGNFASGKNVVVVDDVITTGGSTLQAIEAIAEEGGKIAFVVALVDRQEGGRAAIETRGFAVHALFTRDELLS